MSNKTIMWLYSNYYYVIYYPARIHMILNLHVTHYPRLFPL